MRFVVGVLAALILAGCEDRAPNDPVEPRREATEDLRPPPAMPPPVEMLDRKAFGKLLRDRSPDLLTVESSQIALGMWTAVVTITNKTSRTIAGGEHMVQCVIFDARARRVGISIPIIPPIDLDPGDVFTGQAVAAGLGQAEEPLAYECLFQG